MSVYLRIFSRIFNSQYTAPAADMLLYSQMHLMVRDNLQGPITEVYQLLHFAVCPRSSATTPDQRLGHQHDVPLGRMSMAG